ncbi:PREDICTED: uncharacterized protein LOC101296672 [Fragaria vesca subsp. vesca]|uniref:uncharacterized protein LOC101296672 n=1 Tax=Fragaria vesca subsp. vesca TaxID=101020 RepID=UPI0002C36599|nr:PREDICTED: uncharacterized protein LOC101296672 [Fragaria vesca subsp. vesca]
MNEETPTVESDPSNPFDRKSDIGDGDAASPLSRYSSFGESEYERYCSANSAMGTPSMCSTVTVFNDFPEPDFGSVRSLGFVEEGEGFSLGGRSDRSSNREDRRPSSSGGVEFSKEDGVRGRPGVKYGSSGLELYGNEDDDVGVGGGDASELMSWKVEKSGPPGLMEGSELKCGSDGSDEEGEEGRGVSGGGVVGEDSVMDREDTREVGSGSQLGMEVEERCFDEEVEREEGASSRNEYSEDEGSMYNYGTEDEAKGEFNHQRDVKYYEQSKPKKENENPFLMNSSVAFGSEDWDDFMQESEQSNRNSFSKSVFQDRKELNMESERKGLNSHSVTSHEGACQTEQGKDVTDMPRGSKHVEADNNVAANVKSFRKPAESPNFAEPEGVEDVRDIPVASYQVQAIDDLIEVTKSSITTPTGFQNVEEPEQEDVKDMELTKNKSPGPDESANDPKDSLFANFSRIQLHSEAKEAPGKKGFNIVVDDISDVHTCINTEVTGIDDGQDLCDKNLGKIKVKLDPLSEISSGQLSIHSTRPPSSMKAEFFEDHKPNTPTVTFENNMRKNAHVSEDLSEEYPMPLKTDNLEVNELYDEFVNDMEEILLDSAESPGARFSQGNRNLQSQLSLPLRDGGSTASTSGTDDAYLFNQHSLRIDGVEVVGARQKKGDVSFSERLVGVKEYTVYKMRVWSGNDQWEVERRYRDFFTLYRRLKTLFADHGWSLPSPWFAVEKESRKIFGNASPDVIAERSMLIQECLQSVLHYRFFSSPPSALVWFLSPQDSFPSSMSSNTPDSVNRKANTENVSTLGKTISLIVEVRPYKSLKQMLEAQHYMCAGCHKHFDDGKTPIRDFAQTFGWGKPRLCEYTGQLFCSSCHTNEIAVIPARVLHHWDFTQYAVSQLAKSYLDSIHDQPMLCVSAVNPFLFTKVPALLQVMGVRKKIGAMLPYVRCPFRRSINKGLGSRKYLLESNDFFALRDLIDLSKGAFAVLPVMVETVLSKIRGHITEQCLICCDVGVPCGARQACNDPSSLIFPFQEDEIERCASCESVFHKLCFKKLTDCPCGEQLRPDEPADGRRANSVLGLEVSGVLDLFGKGSGSGLLSGLFSKAKTDSPREHKDGDNVILMGSFPPSSL